MEENLKKYIVYLTICKINKKFYIGVHGITSEKFDGYLGNGVIITKPSSYKKSKTPFQRAVNKYGIDNFIRITLFTFDTAEEAFAKEAEIVNEEFLKRTDVYNISLGGDRGPENEGIPIYQYDFDGNFIRKYDRIIDAANAVKAKHCSVTWAAKEKIACKGYLWSYEYHDKIEPKRKDPHAPRKVAVYDLNGNYIKTYDTVKACKKDYCGCVHVLAGDRNKAGNCTFKYVD